MGRALLRVRAARAAVPAALLGALLAAGALFAPPAPGERSEAPPNAAARAAAEARPVLERYCLDCHSGPKPKGGLDLAAAMAEDAETWRIVAERVAAGEMPPPGKPQPADDERARLVEFARAAVPPGEIPPVVIRRLTRLQFQHAVEDLLGVRVPVAEMLPPDDSGHGFDHLGELLSLSPLHLERYLAAADVALSAALSLDPPVVRETRRIDEASLVAPVGGFTRPDGRWLWSNGETYGEVDLPVEGEYEIRARLSAAQAGPEPARAAIRAGGRELARFDVPETPDRPGVRTVRARLPAGRLRIAAAFLNDYYRPDDPDPAERDRNLLVGSLEVDGPINFPPPPVKETHRRVFFVSPAAAGGEREAARRIVARFADRAFRRPVAAPDLGRLLALYDEARAAGDRYEEAVAAALTAVLVSPRFLFLGEPAVEGAPRRLDDHELAARLSFFLGNGLPDARLRIRAAAGRLSEEAVLLAEADRLLDDPRVRRFTANFAAQWLGLGGLAEAAPDPAAFPDFDPALRSEMREEAERFFHSLAAEDRSILDLLDSPDAFLTERLARHYGVPGVEGPEFRRVVLPDGRRGGVLTMGAVLTLTSNPTRTSPVKRGKWVLSKILDSAPPPPPANIPALPDSAEAVAVATPRERMARHRADPACAGCHVRMDPIGFAFEHYDAVGRWREADGRHPIDAAGVLPDGSAFDGVEDLRRVLLSRRDEFARAFVGALFTYALGRGPTAADAPEIDRAVAATIAEGFRFRAAVKAVILSETFRTRRPEGRAP